MSDPFDRLLLCPTAEALAAALDAASRGALAAARNRRWGPILDEVAGHAEGRCQLDSGTHHGTQYVSAAWWTDRIGRKLVRVCGGHTASGRQRHHSRLDHDVRPPVWHVGPERVYRVRRPGEEPVWLACCACGEVGYPEAIAWTGPRCGGCHDKCEEGLAVPEPAALVEVGRTIYGVAFVEGGLLAVSSEGRALELIGPNGAAEEVYADGDPGEEWEQLRPLAATADGRWLAAADPRHEVVRLWRLGPRGVEEVAPLDAVDDQTDEAAVGLAFSPDGLFLAMGQVGGRVVVWERVDDEWLVWDDLNTARDGEGPATSLAFMHGHPGLALGRRSGVVSFVELGGDRRAGRIRVGDREEVAYLAQPPDGRHLVAVTHPAVGDEAMAIFTTPQRATLRLWDFATQREARTHELMTPSLVALSPDGRHLAWVTHHPERSPAEVVFWDVAAWRGAGSVEWDSEDVIMSLAFSPAGDEIATGGQGGAVKWCPWRRLLGA